MPAGAQEVAAEAGHLVQRNPEQRIASESVHLQRARVLVPSPHRACSLCSLCFSGVSGVTLDCDS